MNPPVNRQQKTRNRECADIGTNHGGAGAPALVQMPVGWAAQRRGKAPRVDTQATIRDRPHVNREHKVRSQECPESGAKDGNAGKPMHLQMPEGEPPRGEGRLREWTP